MVGTKPFDDMPEPLCTRQYRPRFYYAESSDRISNLGDTAATVDKLTFRLQESPCPPHYRSHWRPTCV